jgi:hypothetical protein
MLGNAFADESLASVYLKGCGLITLSPDAIANALP